MKLQSSLYFSSITQASHCGGPKWTTVLVKIHISIIPVRGHEMEPCGTRKNILHIRYENSENDSTSISIFVQGEGRFVIGLEIL